MIPNGNCGGRGRHLYEHEHEREGEARARMLILGIGSIKARTVLLVTRACGGETARGQGKLTMAFPRAASTDHDPCPLHMERLSFDVGGARHRCFT